MRKIVAGLHMSFDGVIEAPERWTGPYMNPEYGQAIGAQFANMDAMLLGRHTYETFAATFAGGNEGMAAQLNNLRKYVVSTTLKSADWVNSTLIQGDVESQIERLKQAPGKNIGISGSPTLVRWLLRKGLLDELNVMVPPVVVGHGKRLFEADGGGELRLKLIDSRALSNGVLNLVYGPA